MIYPTQKMRADPAWRPMIDLMEAQFLTTEEVARRWRYKTASVANMRRNGTGAAYVKLPSGGVRYRVSEVLAHELCGHGAGLTFDRVAAALATCPDLKTAEKRAIESHLRRILCVKVES